MGVLVVDWVFFMVLEYIILPRDKIDYVDDDWDLDHFREVQVYSIFLSQPVNKFQLARQASDDPVHIP